MANAAVDKFFDDDPTAMARTLNMRIRPEDLPELRALYEETIYPALARLDDRARGSDEAMTLDVSLVWARGDEERKQDNTEGEAR